MVKVLLLLLRPNKVVLLLMLSIVVGVRSDGRPLTVSTGGWLSKLLCLLTIKAFCVLAIGTSYWCWSRYLLLLLGVLPCLYSCLVLVHNLLHYTGWNDVVEFISADDLNGGIAQVLYLRVAAMFALVGLLVHEKRACWGHFHWIGVEARAVVLAGNLLLLNLCLLVVGCRRLANLIIRHGSQPASWKLLLLHLLLLMLLCLLRTCGLCCLLLFWGNRSTWSWRGSFAVRQLAARSTFFLVRDNLWRNGKINKIYQFLNLINLLV